MQIKLTKEMQEIALFFSSLPNTYFVGGCVRDILLKKVPLDFDLTTSVIPDGIEEYIVSKGKKPYKLGKRFGTLGVKIGPHLVEITTFRQESYLDQNRKPIVEFTNSLKEDLKRRDFTINALACDFNGKVIDPLNNFKDIENKILKTVGNPKDRFNEDPLRILRAVRFKNSLKLSLEGKTEEQLFEQRFKLLFLSPERIVEELEKTFELENVDDALLLLFEKKLINFLIPEIAIQHNFDQDSPYHSFELHKHTILVVKNLRRQVEPYQKDFKVKMWSALLHDVAKPYTKTKNSRGYSNYIYHDLLGANMANKICKYLKFSNDKRAFVVDTIKSHLQDDCWLRSFDNAAK